MASTGHHHADPEHQHTHDEAKAAAEESLEGVVQDTKLREELAEQKLEQAEQLAHEIAEKKQQLDAVKKAAKQQ